MARLSDGSGAAQCAENLAEQITLRCAENSAQTPSIRGELRHTRFKVWQKSTGDIVHLYSCIISYIFLFVNKIRTFVRVL